MVMHSDAIAAAAQPNQLEQAETWHLKPSTILSADTLAKLNQRSDRQGWQQLAAHLTVLAVSGTLWGLGPWWLALPALVVYGFGFAAMFATMHECVHRTAFANQRLNDWVAWWAGVLSLYNSTFYRRYHKWHHRYTQIPGKDPELDDPLPTNRLTYVWQLSGLPWWASKLRGHLRVARGEFTGCPYIAESVQAEVQRSTYWQLAVYGGAIALSIAVRQPWVITYWLLPLAVGQPILRSILLSEHTGCTNTNNPLTNTRTTLAAWPIRLLMWNMPFHAEHHLYASIPFHALPKAHEQLAPHFAHVVPSYRAAHRQILAYIGRAA